MKLLLSAIPVIVPVPSNYTVTLKMVRNQKVHRIAVGMC